MQKKWKQGSRRKNNVDASAADVKSIADWKTTRQTIATTVESEALEMVNGVIGVAKKGNYLATKYLFEMAGLFPAVGREQTPVEESLVHTLLRRLGFPEAPQADTSTTMRDFGTEGRIESQTPPAMRVE